jgi:hypothetical protein
MGGQPMSELGHFRPSSAGSANRPLPLRPKSGHSASAVRHPWGTASASRDGVVMVRFAGPPPGSTSAYLAFSFSGFDLVRESESYRLRAPPARSARPMFLFSRVLGLTALPDAGDPLLGASHDALQSAAAGRLAPLLYVLAAVSTIRLRDRRDHAQRTGNDNQSKSHVHPPRYVSCTCELGVAASRRPSRWVRCARSIPRLCVKLGALPS